MRVLVIGGGRWQVPLCEFLDSRNYKLLIADPNPDAPCMRFAESAIYCDIRDSDSIFRTVSSMTDRPSLIMTDQSDLAIETASNLSHQFGLPGIKPRVCQIFRNKLRFRSFLESEIGVKFPRYRKVSSTSTLETLIADLGLPFVIKPADSQSSRGFTIISSVNDDLDQAIQESLKHSQLDYLLAEQFIRGTEVTIEGVSVAGQHHVLASSSKQHFRPGIASRLDFPAKVDTAQLQSLVAFHNRLIEATGLENGLTHSEYLIDLATGTFSPVEIACRGGGNLISSDIVPWMSGLDTHALLLDGLLGNDAKVQLGNSTRCATLQFFEFQDGVVPALPDLARLSGLPSNVISEFNVQSGQRVGLATDDRSRHGFAVILSKNNEDLEATREHIDLTFRQITRTP